MRRVPPILVIYRILVGLQIKGRQDQRPLTNREGSKCKRFESFPTVGVYPTRRPFCLEVFMQFRLIVVLFRKDSYGPPSVLVLCPPFLSRLSLLSTFLVQSTLHRVPGRFAFRICKYKPIINRHTKEKKEHFTDLRRR